MFADLEAINSRPAPFAHITTSDLWTDPHTSAQMLAYHLDPDIDLSSRCASFIDRSVDWIVTRFDVSADTRIIDFGCGPGLYATRLAKAQAAVTGVDFSARSITYAREAAERDDLSIDFRHQDYLTFRSDNRFNLIVMIFCDFCALSPDQRRHMLRTFRSLLAPDGHILLDVHSLSLFEQRTESASYELNGLNGFWSPNPYYSFLNGFKYEDEKLLLDKYTIVERDRTRTVYNWLQCFSPESLEAELKAQGLAVDALHGNVAGVPYDPEATEFAVVARAAPG